MMCLLIPAMSAGITGTHFEGIHWPATILSKGTHWKQCFLIVSLEGRALMHFPTTETFYGAMSGKPELGEKHVVPI